MTLLMMESFADRMWNLGKWDYNDGSGTWSGTGSRFGGPALSMAGTNLDRAIWKLITPSSEVFVGAAWRISALGDNAYANSPLTLWTDNGVTSHLRLKYWGGTMYLNRGTTEIATAPMFGIGEDHYVELSGTIHDSTGHAVVKVDGVTVIDFTGDTRNGGTLTDIDAVSFGPQYQSTTVISDIYICNSAGSAPTNTFLGDVSVEMLSPSGNGNSSVLVGSDADSTDNYLLVDEIPPSSADYVESGTQGDKDTYVMGNITGTPTTIFGVQISSYAAKTDSGAKFSRPVVRSGTTDYVGSSKTLSTGYLARQDVWETDPDTAAAWIEAGVNAAEIGFEVRDS